MTNPTEYVPKSYRRRVSTYWWIARWTYLKFILREISSLFVAWVVVITLLEVRALTRGSADYAELQKWLANPFIMALNAISAFFILYHSVTWFNLAPKAMVVRMHGKRLPTVAVAAANYVVWVLVSAAVARVLLRG